MLRRVFVLSFVCSIACPILVQAQDTNKLSFLIPSLYGPNGFVLPNPTHTAHFTSAFQSEFSQINVALASQLTALPIPPPSSGFTFRIDSATGLQVLTDRSLGPVVADRAETIGRNRFSIGFNYQHFGFDTIEGEDLNNLPAVFSHDQVVNLPFERDIITTRNNIDTTVDQFTFFFTYGITSRLEASLAVPVVRSELSVTSTATIQRIGTADDPTVHAFAGANPNTALFQKSGEASGIGDLVVRLKGEAARWEGGGFAVGVDFRFPTGDEEDLLGAGAAGVRPFGTLSFTAGPLAPHVNLGYQWNGKSKLAASTTVSSTGQILPPTTKEDLPDQFLYVLGTDIKLPKRVTLAFDYLGQRVLDAQRLEIRDFVAFNNSTHKQSGFSEQSYTTHNAAAGIKAQLGKVVVAFNVLFKLDDAGLRDKVTPLVGIQFNH